MAERNVDANTIVLTVAAVSGTQKLIVCLTQTGYQMANNAIDASSFCGNKKLPGVTTFSLPFTGQRMLDPGGSHVSEFALFNFIKNKTQIDWTLGPVAPSTGDIVYTGTGYLNSFNTDNGTNGVPTMTGTIDADSDSVDGAVTV